MDKVKQLRTQGIIVRCYISRYVGRHVTASRIEDSWGIDHTKQRVFFRYGKRPFSKSEIRNLKLIDSKVQVDPFGGETEIQLIDAESKGLMGYGKAICLDCEKFNRSMGFQIALKRALKNAKVTV